VNNLRDLTTGSVNRHFIQDFFKISFPLISILTFPDGWRVEIHEDHIQVYEIDVIEEL